MVVKLSVEDVLITVVTIVEIIGMDNQILLLKYVTSTVISVTDVKTSFVVNVLEILRNLLKNNRMMERNTVGIVQKKLGRMLNKHFCLKFFKTISSSPFLHPFYREDGNYKKKIWEEGLKKDQRRIKVQRKNIKLRRGSLLNVQKTNV